MSILLLCYEAYIKCCNYIGKSSVASTCSTHLLSLQSRVIQKLLHYTESKFCIDMVIKRKAFYCIECDVTITLGQFRIIFSSNFAFIWTRYEYFVASKLKEVESFVLHMRFLLIASVWRRKESKQNPWKKLQCAIVVEMNSQKRRCSDA